MNSVNKNIVRSILTSKKSLDTSIILKCNQSQLAGILKYATAVSAINLMKAYSAIKNIIQGKKPDKKEYPQDTVVIYQFPRGYYTPSLSPHALKLETWCRGANIKYQNELGMKTSSQGLMPFISLNDYFVEDSQKCVEYLSKVFQVNLNNDLTPEQQAISRTVITLCDDNLKWIMVLHRFWYAKKGHRDLGLPILAHWYFGYRAYKACWYNGFARYSKDDLYELGKKDLSALNALIGNKNYLFSDTKPCDADFTVFGICAQIKYNDRGPLNSYLNTECHNILRHIENIKQTYWKDWNLNTRVNKPTTKTKKFNFNPFKRPSK